MARNGPGLSQPSSRSGGSRSGGGRPSYGGGRAARSGRVSASKPAQRPRTPAGRNGRSSRRQEVEEEEEEEEGEEEEENEGSQEEEEADGEDGADGRGEQDVDDDDDDDAGADEDLKVKKVARLPVSESVRKVVKTLGRKESQRKVDDLVRMALFSEYRRQPIRRDEITKRVLGKSGSRAFPYVFNRAQATLRKVFCYEMVELRAKGMDQETFAQTQATQATGKRKEREDDAGEATGSRTAGKMWIVRSIMPQVVIEAMTQANADIAAEAPDVNDAAGPSSQQAESDGRMLNWETSDGQVGSMGLTFLILSLILLNGRSLPDDQFRAYLHRFGLGSSTPLPVALQPDSLAISMEPSRELTRRRRKELSSATDSTAHPSSVRTFVDQLVKQQYIVKVKNATAGGQTQARERNRGRNSGEGGDENCEWKWGPRAEAEIGEVAVAQFISGVYVDGDEPQEEVEDEAVASQVRSNGNGRSGRRGGGTQRGAATQGEPKMSQSQIVMREVERAAGSQLLV